MSVPAETSSSDSDDASESDRLLANRSEEDSKSTSLKLIVKTLMSPTMLLLLVGGSIRYASSGSWSYNAQLYYEVCT